MLATLKNMAGTATSGCLCSLLHLSLRKICPYFELFWSTSSCIWAEYGEILRISLYSVRMQENADQNYSEYGHFSHNVGQSIWNLLPEQLKRDINLSKFKK